MKKVIVGLVVSVLACAAGAQTPPVPPAAWAFAVSGDSRDCGDLVMPKIARAIEGEAGGPAAELYWHLGDFRRMYDIDCDILKRRHPSYDCKSRPPDQLDRFEMADYLDMAWDDFIERQLGGFRKTPVLLGIGNHELYGRTRDDYRKAFRKWLLQAPIHEQRVLDSSRGILTTEGSTFYRVVRKGVDFISLDNADENGFSTEQLVWLARVLAADAADDSVMTIVAGMHAALPYSTSRGHAMDASCAGLCSGQQAYDLLFRAQNLAAPPEKRKHVYVLASHSHFFKENIYDTPEHRGQVLPGWIVGTAGAQQYQDTIRYGYLRMEVGADGAITAQFREVGADTPPLATGPGARELTDFCYGVNKRPPPNDVFRGDCACGAAGK
jgi:hypothetical protein